MALSRYIARRLVITVATLALISVLIFLVVEVLPGDVARLRVGQFATAESIEHARRELGLDRSLPARYGDWIRRFATGDWGDSWRLQIPIRPLVLERLANSAILAGLALAVIVPVSFLGGIVAAMKRNKLADRVLTIGGMFGIAVPEFVSSMFLILAFSLWLPVFPSSSLVPEGAPFVDHVKAFVLPVTALTLVLFGYISRMVRASMIEELLSSYTRTAVLKGLSRRQVVFKHVLRNALPLDHCRREPGLVACRRARRRRERLQLPRYRPAPPPIRAFTGRPAFRGDRAHHRRNPYALEPCSGSPLRRR
jgi:peptide/nickel transport system permease protein